MGPQHMEEHAEMNIQVVKILLCPIFGLGFFFSSQLSGLPINFGRNIGGLNYAELRSKNFAVYHNEPNRAEAEFVLKSLEFARPHLEGWLKIKRDRPFPVILSSHSTNASFANFITDALEIQSGGYTSRDLSWHEYVHGSMYVHFENILGPAGSAIHLAWLPSWFVEGLAEAISISSSSSEQSSVERTYALSRNWPHFNKIHSLYNKHDFASLGYALSGSFVKYMITAYPNVKLSAVLEDFFSASMPWHWPYALVPFMESLPFDRVCRKHYGKNTEELYEEFKKNRETYWSQLTTQDSSYKPFLLNLEKSDKGPSSKYDFSDAGSPWFEAGKLYAYEWRNGYKYKLQFELSADSRFMGEPVQEEIVATAGSSSEEEHFEREDLVTDSGKYRVYTKTTLDSRRLSFIARQGFPRIERGEARINSIYRLKNHLVWEEHENSEARLCQTEWIQNSATKKATAVHCFEKKTGAEDTSILGVMQGSVLVRRSSQTLSGSNFQYAFWDPEKFSYLQSSEQVTMEILAVYRRGDKLYRRVRGLNFDFLEEVVSPLPWDVCSQQLRLNESVASIAMDRTSDKTFIKFFNGSEYRGTVLGHSDLPWNPQCQKTGTHSSPLTLVAQTGRHNVNLNEALLAVESVDALEKFTTAQSPLQSNVDAQAGEAGSQNSPPEYYFPARSNFRHVVSVPWLGQDSDGMQIALMSVPLMDEMQNQEVRAYLGYGLGGGYPHVQLSYHNNASVVNWDVSVFKYQLWDGRGNINAGKTDADGKDLAPLIKEVYLTEQGVNSTLSFYAARFKTALNLGLKLTELTNYKNGETHRLGKLIETEASLVYGDRYGSWSWSLGGTSNVAPKASGSDFQYDKVGLFMSGAKSFNWREFTIKTSLSGSQTRGPKKRSLQEVYRPVRVFVPGAGGGGYNNFSAPLVGQGSLFTAIFGNTKLEAETNLSLLLFEDIGWMYKIFYLDSVIATAYFKEGYIGYGKFDQKKFTKVSSHGYQADSTIDVKGINLNFGLGIGQVVKEDWQSYLSFGFSALF